MKNLPSRIAKELLVEFFFLNLTALSVIVLLRLSLFEAGDATANFWDMQVLALPYNLLLVALPLTVLRWFLPRREVYLLAVVGASSLAILNFRKVAMLHQAIVPSDFFKLRMTPIFLKFVGLREYFAAITLACLPVGVVVAARRRKRPPERFQRLTWFPALALASYFVFVGPRGRIPSTELRDRLFPPVYNEAHSAVAYGLIFNMLLNGEVLKLQVPEDYSQEQIRRDLSAFPIVSSTKDSSRDVILILLESFYDYTAHGKARFSRDFHPFYHSLRKESQILSVFTPETGGGTANSEYEVLTGMPIHVLPGGGVPYEQFVKHEIPSVVDFAAKQGFFTVAMHPWSRMSWNRDAVYPEIGFQQFISQEDFPPGAVDGTMFKRSLDLLREHKRRKQFQFLITTGTHGPYRQKVQSPWLKSNLGDDEVAVKVNAYAEAMHTLDHDLENYFLELRKLPSPPIVILFGDHQPEFDGKINAPTPSDPMSLYRNEVLVWGERQPLEESGSAREQDLFCLAPKLMEMTFNSTDPYPYFRFIEHFCETRGSISKLDWGRKGDAELLAQLKRLTFDRLLGEQYSTPTMLLKK